MKWAYILFIVTIIAYGNAFSLVNDISNSFTNFYATPLQERTPPPVYIAYHNSASDNAPSDLETVPSDAVSTASTEVTRPTAPAPATAPARTTTPKPPAAAPVTTAAIPPTTTAPRTPRAGNSQPLFYAATLTSCADDGERAASRYARSRGVRSGAGYCAVGVRHSLMCMFKKLGRPRKVHCGGSAYNYYGEGCMERMGFVNDMSMCNTKGVVRVYYGYKHKNRNYSGGDQHGHIEFLGNNNWWHAGVASSQPINNLQKAGNRRILKACYILPGVNI